LLIYNRLIGSKGRFATVGGKSYRARRIALGRMRVPALIAVVLYIVVTFVLPFLTLLWVSLQPFYSGVSVAALHRMSLAGYRDLIHSNAVLSALRNTIVLGICSALLAVGLALLVSWVLVRARSRAVWLLDLLAFMPHAIPGVVIGLTVGLIYLLLPIPVYGTIWIVVIAISTQYISLGTRLTTSGLVQLQESLEHAGATSGAGMFVVWRRILLPLLRPTVANALLLVFLASCQNLTLPLMLQSPHNTTVSTLLWGRWNTGDVNGTAVLSVATTVVTVVAVTAVRMSTIRRDDDNERLGT
jgi:iron(III) transport system permease protein